MEAASSHPGCSVTTVGRPDLSLERPETIAAVLRSQRPDVVINAAAFTNVDRAESEPDRAYEVNRDGAAHVAAMAEALHVPFLQISTDYVFSGSAIEPYSEKDPVAPQNVYGTSKLAGEQAVLAAHSTPLIIRTSWVFSPFGSNFVKTILRLACERDRLRVVSDQRGCPTSALDLADAILRIVPPIRDREPHPNLLHLSGSGDATWFDLACRTVEQALPSPARRPPLDPITTAEYPLPARRPVDSRLNCTAFAAHFGFKLRQWTEAVDDVVRRLL
jgi:dTDP-4-dehydrorhamnose reductase